jgi:fatty acid desaturase
MPPFDLLGRDLLITSPARRLVAFVRPLAGVVVFAALWSAGLVVLAPVGLAATFVCVIGTTHDLVHSSFGLRRKGRDAMLAVLPALILQSGHTYRTTHPQHHRAFPGGADDPEGLVADRGLVRALVEGPLFLPRLWLWSWRRQAAHRRQRRLLATEGALLPLAFGAGVALLPWTASVLTWVVLAIMGGWLLPLVTVWLPHRNHGDTLETSAGSLRWPLVPRVLLGLTYHLEHHLYPQVPSHHMHELARRLQPYLN